jgi:hypothetical protein
MQQVWDWDWVLFHPDQWSDQLASLNESAPHPAYDREYPEAWPTTA